MARSLVISCLVEVGRFIFMEIRELSIVGKNSTFIIGARTYIAKKKSPNAIATTLFLWRTAQFRSFA